MQRILPQNAQPGELVSGQFPYVQIDQKAFKLAPGVLIFDQDNRTIVHGALPTQAAVVYTTDSGGDVTRIYILKPDEQARLDPRKAR